jgi:hypothetical protein
MYMPRPTVHFAGTPAMTIAVKAQRAVTIQTRGYRTLTMSYQPLDASKPIKSPCADYSNAIPATPESITASEKFTARHKARAAHSQKFKDQFAALQKAATESYKLGFEFKQPIVPVVVDEEDEWIEFGT